MRERNKRYKERDKETYMVARSFWPTNNLDVEGELPMYMLRAKVHETRHFLSAHRDHTTLEGYQSTDLDRWKDSKKQ